MLPGKDLYYECPKCKNILSKGSLLSGNNIGAELFSDGKQIAPMLPEFPSISKCSKCSTIFWLNKVSIIDNDEIEDVEQAKFLTPDEYIIAIQNNNYKSKKEELFLRTRLWWKFNNRIRDNKALFEKENDEKIWAENIERLIKLLNYNDIDQRIMIAELNRNLGNFQKCSDILATLTNPDYDDFKELFAREIANKNTNVFKLWG
jgi:hypothetical protein